jgi:hypothetical protein
MNDEEYCELLQEIILEDFIFKKNEDGAFIIIYYINIYNKL